MNDEIKAKSQELIALCHEQGLVAIVGIADKKSGRSIRAMDGTFRDVLMLISILFVQLEHQTKENANNLVSAVGKLVKKIRKDFDLSDKWEYEKGSK